MRLRTAVLLAGVVMFAGVAGASDVWMPFFEDLSQASLDVGRADFEVVQFELVLPGVRLEPVSEEERRITYRDDAALPLVFWAETRDKAGIRYRITSNSIHYCPSRCGHAQSVSLGNLPT